MGTEVNEIDVLSKIEFNIYILQSTNSVGDSVQFVEIGDSLQRGQMA